MASMLLVVLRKVPSLFLFIAGFLNFSHGFLIIHPQQRSQRSIVEKFQQQTHHHIPAVIPLRSSLLLRKSKESNEDEDDINLEQERKRLESLLMGSSSASEGDKTGISSAMPSSSSEIFLTLPFLEWKDQLSKISPPPLTSIGRERMDAEITLLESLATSDEAIPELWNLWYNFRGPQAAKELMQTEALVAQGQAAGWKQAEELLREIVAKEGLYFVEPLNRLATLLFLQSRFDESLVLCEIVLKLKPWHFGALSGIVMVHQGLQDNASMLEWASKRMPPLPKNKQDQVQEEERQMQMGIESRQTWVYRMVDLARASLLREEMGLEESFLDLDDTKRKKPSQGNIAGNTLKEPSPNIQDFSFFLRNNTKGTVEEEEEDAWQ